MKYECPACQRVLYNRRLKHCGFCGALIPEDLRFTPGEAALLEAKLGSQIPRNLVCGSGVVSTGHVEHSVKVIEP